MGSVATLFMSAVLMTTNDCICLQNRPGHARQSGDGCSCCSRVTLLALLDVEEENDEECLDPQPLFCLYSGQRDWRLSSLHRESAFLKLCCLLHPGSYFRLDPWRFFHMLSEMFLIFFTAGITSCQT